MMRAVDLRNGGEERGHPAWEHLQIDISPEMLCVAESDIHTFLDTALTLGLVARDGRVVDFILRSHDPAIEPTALPTPGDGAGQHALLLRSWHVAAYDLSVHVESWVEEDGRGFVDVFGRRGGGPGE